MNKETRKKVALMLLAQVVVVVAIYVFSDSEVIYFDDDDREVEIPDMSQIEGGCIDIGVTDICTYAGVNKDELYYCACVGNTEYCSCGWVFGDGCIRLSPNEELDNFKMCASDYSATPNSISVRTSAKPCFKLIFWDICFTIWKQQLTFSR